MGSILCCGERGKTEANDNSAQRNEKFFNSKLSQSGKGSADTAGRVEEAEQEKTGANQIQNQAGQDDKFEELKESLQSISENLIVKFKPPAAAGTSEEASNLPDLEGMSQEQIGRFCRKYLTDSQPRVPKDSPPSF